MLKRPLADSVDRLTGGTMALIKPQPQSAKNVTLQIRIEEQLKLSLAEYVEFLDCTESYLVSEALKLVFEKDREFKIWSRTRGNSQMEQKGNEKMLSKDCQTSRLGSEGGSQPEEHSGSNLFSDLRKKGNGHTD